jgi:mycothiol synthase
MRVATLDDVDGVYELLDVRSRAAFGVSEVVRSNVEADFRRVAADRWIAEQGGAIAGYAHLLPTHDIVIATAEAAVADALLAQVEERARELGLGEIVTIVVPEDEPVHALVRRGGFTHHHDILRMWRRLDGVLPSPAWPEGIIVRAYTDADGERVHALLDEAYAAWDRTYVPQEHADWLAFMTDHDEFDPAMWLLVEREGELVACALHWKEQQRRGWVKDIVVRASERGNGLGTSLLQAGFQEYARRGAEQVGLKVDATNPTGAPRLYERAGFVTDRRYGTWIKPL